MALLTVAVAFADPVPPAIATAVASMLSVPLAGLRMTLDALPVPVAEAD